MAQAVNDFNPEKELLFNSYLSLHFKKCFMEMIGRRTSKRDMLESCFSLDVPISENDDTTVGEKIKDPEVASWQMQSQVKAVCR